MTDLRKSMEGKDDAMRKPSELDGLGELRLLDRKRDMPRTGWDDFELSRTPDPLYVDARGDVYDVSGEWRGRIRLD